MLGKENKRAVAKIPEDFNGDIEAYWYLIFNLVKSCISIKRIANNQGNTLKLI